MSIKTYRGDTIIEVTLAIAVFCLVAILSITIMNVGVTTAETSLEVTMARNEIDAQAEALRFIHNSYLAERSLPIEQQEYRSIWFKLTRGQNIIDPGLANIPAKVAPFTLSSCDEAYSGTSDIPSIFQNHAFVINTRLLEPENTGFNLKNYFTDDDDDGIDDNTGASLDYSSLLKDVVVSSDTSPDKFTPATLNPRLIFSRYGNASSENTSSELDESGPKLYRQVSRAEGIWVIAVRDTTKISSPNPTTKELAASVPEFFDFYIRTCWYAPGRQMPSTIGTILRLYNPEVIEGAR